VGEPQVAHQLAAEIVRAFKPNPTDQQAGPLQASSSDSSVIVSYSSGRSPRDKANGKVIAMVAKRQSQFAIMQIGGYDSADGPERTRASR